MRDKILSIQTQLNSWFVDRESEILGLILAALSGYHIFLLGPPGTGKTRLIRLFTDLIGGSTFKVQLGKFTEPRQLFGRLSITALENDKEKYLDNNKLQKCDMAFIDEIWKASNAIVNDLLTVLEDKVFIEDGMERQIPLISCAAASNELPTEGEGLEAIYDRFMLRFYTGDISPSDFGKMLQNPPPQSAEKMISVEEFRLIMEEVKKVKITDSAIKTIGDVRNAMKKKGIEVSPRRWAKSMRVMQAMAWLSGSAVVTDDHLIVLAHILWRKPEERETVTDAIMDTANPVSLKIMQVLDSVKGMIHNMPDVGPKATSAEKSQVMTQLTNVQDEISKNIEELRELGDRADVKDAMTEINSMMKMVDDHLIKIVSRRMNKVEEQEV